MKNFSLALSSRQPVLSRIEKWIDAFEHEYRQNMVLLGPSGAGKTQFLLGIYRSLNGREALLPVYIDARALDFDHFIDRWLGGLLTGALEAPQRILPSDFQSLVSAAAGLLPKTTEKIKHFKKMARREKPSLVLKELFALAGALHNETGRKLIMIIDQFDALDQLPATDPFAILGREIMVEKNVLYLAASSNPCKAREIFREKLSLLFGNFEMMDFGRLGFEDTARYFESRLSGKKLSSAQWNFLIRMTDGHPFYLEILADRMNAFFYPSNQVVSGQEPLPIGDEIFHEAFLRELLNSKGRLAIHFEKKLQLAASLSKDSASCVRALLALAQGRRRVLAIAAFMGRKNEETRKVLQRLAAENFIKKSGPFYCIEDPLFCFWLIEIYQKKIQGYFPSEELAGENLAAALKREFETALRDSRADIASRVEALFKEFRNDVLPMGEKKIKCPQFSEIAFRPTNGRVFPVFAKSPNARWLCQISRQTVHEEDVSAFLEDLRRTRKNIQRKVMITLGGIDQNARLMAQQASIQLWGLRDFNELLELYNLPKMILLPEGGKHGPALGALAQSIHSA